jgi:hypothetical protein
VTVCISIACCTRDCGQDLRGTSTHVSLTILLRQSGPDLTRTQESGGTPGLVLLPCTTTLLCRIPGNLAAWQHLHGVHRR